MKVRYDPDLLRYLKKLNVRIRHQFKKKILLFSKQPDNSELNNHQLKREWKGHRSININSDFRAIYKEIQLVDETIAYFVAIGRHSELYKNN